MAPFLYYSLLSLVLILSVKFLVESQSRKLKNLPPGPPRLPIIGNLHYMKPPVHLPFAKLSETYGDMISLWFGSRLVVVLSSLSLARECFGTNDVILANRPRFLAGKYASYKWSTLATTSYGEHWRNVRRIATVDVLSSHRLNSFTAAREDEIRRMVWRLGQEAMSREGEGEGEGEGFVRVGLRERLMETTFNNMMRMISGKRFHGDGCTAKDVEEARVFRDDISNLLELAAAQNKADFFPFLRVFDFEGLLRRLKRIASSTDKFLQNLIEEHRSGKYANVENMISHLLKLSESQPECYSDQTIKGLIQAMLIAGTDTSALTVEWTMSELLNAPEVFQKAKDEIDTNIGKDRVVDEQDMAKLPYLQNIVNETLRLHPAAPLSLPHESSEDCTIGGYHIPRGTIVLTNLWLIHRDPKLWSDPLSFKPERFEKGEENKLIAFGIGRRSCAGQGLAQRLVTYTVALLIQCFQWKRESEEKIDMREGKGLAVPKLIPLQAMCKSLPIVNKV
ncbi:hypothetical protein Fmac_008096 [Flemingia macrophylla]|uniref:Cytochrome P450 n=1 Tax=Flemingia macrophylla TaxID=520843 RepID=A0ABD1MWZ7_9FABA